MIIVHTKGLDLIIETKLFKNNLLIRGEEMNFIISESQVREIASILMEMPAKNVFNALKALERLECFKEEKGDKNGAVKRDSPG